MGCYTSILEYGVILVYWNVGVILVYWDMGFCHTDILGHGVLSYGIIYVLYMYTVICGVIILVYQDM